MRALFLGTPEAAVPSLHALAGIADVALVVSRPDRPRGRSGQPRPSEVTAAAEELGLTVAKPESPAALADHLRTVGPVDVALVVAYGMLIPAAVLAVPGAGFVNVHFSVLPRWRGAAPVQRAILAGDVRTGVTLMQMDAGLDTGAILATSSTQIGPAETAETLTGRLADAGASLVTRWLPAHVRGGVAPTAQSTEAATAAPKLRSEERWVDVHDSAASVVAAVRGLTPWPGAWVHHATGALRILAAEPGKRDLAPGQLKSERGTVEMGVGDGSIRVTNVQPEGRRPMAAADWARGLHDELGDVW